MKKLILYVLLMLGCFNAYSQQDIHLKSGLTAEQNLAAIGKLAPYNVGGHGFDNRYEGVKGSPRLLDTLLPSFLRVRGQDYYIQLATDLDLVNNTLIFIHPKTRQLLSIPSDIIDEVVINRGEKELVFRTTQGKNFGKDFDGIRFFQSLMDKPVKFIKMPVKIFIESDYKGLYTSDRRYDEYQTNYRYYLAGPDSIFHQIQLTGKSLIKLYPAKKEIITGAMREIPDEDTEARILLILQKF